jgi:transcription elongation factor
MAAVAAIAGVGMMVCCSSSVAALMMGGDGDDSSDSAAGAGAGAKTPVVPTLPSGQYVKLVHTVGQDTSAAGNDDDKNKILNLAELEVFAEDGTTSLAAGKTVTGTAFNTSHFPGTNLVDGNMTNFAHTFGRAADVLDEFLVDLGSVQEIEKIKITNRVDCCQKRAIGVKAVILGADGTTVIKETPAITTEAATYTFTFPGTAWA